MNYLVVGAVVASIPDIMEKLGDQTKVVIALFVTDTFLHRWENVTVSGVVAHTSPPSQL
jgi:hypothetical protein